MAKAQCNSLLHERGPETARERVYKLLPTDTFLSLSHIIRLDSLNLDPDVYPKAGPCSNASLQRNLGLCHGLQYTRCTSSAVA